MNLLILNTLETCCEIQQRCNRDCHKNTTSRSWLSDLDLKMPKAWERQWKLRHRFCKKK